MPLSAAMIREVVIHKVHALNLGFEAYNNSQEYGTRKKPKQSEESMQLLYWFCHVIIDQNIIITFKKWWTWSCEHLSFCMLRTTALLWEKFLPDSSHVAQVEAAKQFCFYFHLNT